MVLRHAGHPAGPARRGDRLDTSGARATSASRSAATTSTRWSPASTSRGVDWVVPVSTDDEGLPTEQTKAKIADPSGNVIELKTYRDVDAALEISPPLLPGGLRPRQLRSPTVSARDPVAGRTERSAVGGEDVSGDPRTARQDGRAVDQLRPVRFDRDYTVMAPGSVLVTFGQTKVLCTASVEERVPPWMRGTGRGWVTAEYSMLPGSTPERASREAAKGKQSGRTQEIQRLIARSLRAVCDLVTLGEVQITVDCDALQADGGTRTASICGAYVALHDACTRLVQAGTISTHPLTDSVAAVSVGIIDGVPMLDLPYVEDSRAEVDMNVVMTGAGRFVEVQGTAEGMAFTRSELDTLLGLAEAGIKELTGMQAAVLAEAPPAAVSGPAARAAAARAGVGQPRQGQGDRGRPLGRHCRSSWCRGPPACPTWWRTPTRCSTTPA